MAKMTVTRSFNGNLDASFSTYLNLKPTQSTTTLHAHHPNNTHLGCAVDDCEISIFDAQKYFNEGNTNNNSNATDNHHLHSNQIKSDTKRVPLARVSLGDLPRLSSASSADTQSRNNYRLGGRSFHATPTASSEASWNSQTGLLSNPPGAIKVSLRNVPTTTATTSATATTCIKYKKARSGRSSWFFGRRCPCPCTGQKSIQVEEKLVKPTKSPVPSVILSNTKPVVENLAVLVKETNKSGNNVSNSPKFTAEMGDRKFSPENSHRIVATGRSFSDNASGFAFPILNDNPVKLLLNPMRVAPPINTNPNSDEPPRESLEVFRPYEEESLSSLDLHHRERRSFAFPASPKSRMTTVTDDDVASDASSDLFEIESFSTQTTTTTCPVLYRRRDSLEDEEMSTSSIHLRRRLSAVTNGGMGGLYYPMMTPTECYEPSEASIDWSVTTAEGFERGSLTNYPIANGMSEIGTREEEEDHASGRNEQENRKKGGGWNALLSCRCKKAVGLGAAAAGGLNHHDEPSSGLAKCNADNTTRKAPVGFNKPPLAVVSTRASYF